MSTRLPDFLIIGAMKSGTTTLHQHLVKHPQVFMSSPKEPNFFSIDEVYGRGEQWYRNLFADATESQICGEASPSYSRHPRFTDTPARIASLLPDVKLVYIMRHPVDRFYSNYVFDRSYGHNEPIRDTLTERSYVLETSNYMLQIERYLEHFSRDQFLPLLLDDLQTSTSAVLEKLYNFLGVSPHTPDASEPLQANQRGRNHVAHQCNTSLQKFRSLPGVSVMKKMVPSSIRTRVRDGWMRGLPDSRLGKWLANRHTAAAEPLTTELRKELLARLAEPTARLEQFLDRDLSAWKV